MQKKSKGIIFLGVLFILFGVIFSGIGIFVFAESGWEKVVPKIIDSGVAKTLEGMKTFLAEKEQVKLKASGKLDQFKIEYDSFRQELVRLAEEYKAKLPQINRLFAGIYLLAGIFSLIAGIGLIAHKNWGRNISYSSILSICCSYVFFWYVIYPMGFMMNFITDRANALYLLIDPLDPAYRVLSKYAGQSTVYQIIFGFPFSACHLFLIILFGVILYYLSRPETKVFLKK